MIQKIHRFGNSLAVVIPATANKAHRIEPGEMVEVVETDEGWRVTPVSVAPRLSPELRKLVDKIVEERAEVFKALAE